MPIINGMLLSLVLILVLVPMIELVILFQVHHALALQWGSLASLLITIGAIIVTGVLGAALARHQGVGVFRDLQRHLGEGKLPGQALLDGVLILVGAALLLTPGFVTDLFGFSLLIPVSRAGYRKLLIGWARRKMQSGAMNVSIFQQGTSVENGEQVIETTADPPRDSEEPDEDGA